MDQFERLPRGQSGIQRMLQKQESQRTSDRDYIPAWSSTDGSLIRSIQAAEQHRRTARTHRFRFRAFVMAQRKNAEFKWVVSGGNDTALDPFTEQFGIYQGMSFEDYSRHVRQNRPRGAQPPSWPRQQDRARTPATPERQPNSAYAIKQEVEKDEIPSISAENAKCLHATGIGRRGRLVQRF